MGLSKRLNRLAYVWGWRLRYWWFDTPGGRTARVMAASAVAVLGSGVLVYQVVMVHRALDPKAPVQGVWWWVVQLLIAAAISAVAAILAPRPKPPQPVEAQTPQTVDGLSVKHHFGTVWEDGEFILAWKIVGRTAIKTKGGKK